MLADLHQGGYKASPLGRVHRRSSLSRSDDVVCHNFTSDRIKGAARPTRKILLLAHERRCCSRKSRVPPPPPPPPLGSGGQRCAPRLQVHRCILEPLRFPTARGTAPVQPIWPLASCNLAFLKINVRTGICAVPIARLPLMREKRRGERLPSRQVAELNLAPKHLFL